MRRLLSPAGLERLDRDVFGPEGLDVVSADSADPLPCSQGDEGGIVVEVLCDTGQHSIPDGSECPHCGSNPKCAGCPGKET